MRGTINVFAISALSCRADTSRHSNEFPSLEFGLGEFIKHSCFIRVLPCQLCDGSLVSMECGQLRETNLVPKTAFGAVVSSVVSFSLLQIHIW